MFWAVVGPKLVLAVAIGQYASVRRSSVEADSGTIGRRNRLLHIWYIHLLVPQTKRCQEGHYAHHGSNDGADPD
jgi:hypothetical protein